MEGSEFASPVRSVGQGSRRRGTFRIGNPTKTTVVAGILWDHLGHTSVFVYGAVFAALGSVGLILLVPKTTGGAPRC